MFLLESYPRIFLFFFLLLRYYSLILLSVKTILADLLTLFLLGKYFKACLACSSELVILFIFRSYPWVLFPAPYLNPRYVSQLYGQGTKYIILKTVWIIFNQWLILNYFKNICSWNEEYQIVSLKPFCDEFMNSEYIKLCPGKWIYRRSKDCTCSFNCSINYLTYLSIFKMYCWVVRRTWGFWYKQLETN